MTAPVRQRRPPQQERFLLRGPFFYKYRRSNGGIWNPLQELRLDDWKSPAEYFEVI